MSSPSNPDALWTKELIVIIAMINGVDNVPIIKNEGDFLVTIMAESFFLNVHMLRHC